MELSFGCVGLNLVSARRCWCAELRLEYSPQLLQNEMGKCLQCATLVTALELLSVRVRDIVRI